MMQGCMFTHRACKALQYAIIYMICHICDMSERVLTRVRVVICLCYIDAYV